MNLEYFQEQIENEREWREGEISFLNNIQESLQKEEDRERIRRSILCIIYAHIEGFVRFIFFLYIEQINNEKLTCSQVRPAIAAAAFYNEFRSLRDKNKKDKFFKNKLPDEGHLHGLSREIEFIENIGQFYNHPVSIPDDFVSTGGNVGREVIEKLLFQVGLEYQSLKDIYAPLNKLLRTRNKIVHGVNSAGIQDKDYKEFIECSRQVISSISHRIIKAYIKKEFLLHESST
uniref:RiboL-PSP-HEPN domain-containing protein n=1 Tax=Candidatus Kentrum sp. MB TaxID=2138164 RepID=A0A450XPB4_9GAMM|nr:MAG: hypothetical protein BECKMB1821G_GA0114241_102412 [Candidatus Kentron sp. MB]VFK31175.1 MAG: hypothetical protein BECKMB1821I_GA0114274_102111 [Candidatus Kentron sp. MB]VFK75378.1 MAG: hypothetical protein BECKMB1821H_GA0114242_102112 [Candidatus Kentron sp. MB]